MSGVLLKKIVDFVVPIADPEQIILFGSYAREKQTVNSDIDLLIVTELIHQKRALTTAIRQFVREQGLRSDVLLCANGALQRAKKKPHGFLNSIQKEGKVIYKRAP
ncbi:MAG: nucleotidyltransferase domain-containing protein [Cytophagales bacterium]|nr:nucleotidyltransferase domain-containing protein [Cytophagales bacterium]